MLEPAAFRALLKEKRLGPVYLFVAEEEFLSKQLIDEIKEQILVEGLEDFNFDRLNGNETDLSSIATAALTAPMMVEKRLIIVRNAESVDDSGIALFERFINSPPDSSLLILVANDAPPKTKWAEILIKKNLAVLFSKTSEKNLTGWIVNYIRKQGYRILPPAASLLVQYIGNDLSAITSQLNKALLSIKQGETIDESKIMDLVLRSRHHKYWELSDAVAEKKLPQAIIILNNMLDDGEPEPVITGILTNFFKRLLTARIMLDSGIKPDDICDAMGQKWYRDKFIRQVRLFDRARLRTIFSNLRQSDQNIKTGFLPPRDNLERILLNICLDIDYFPTPSLSN